MKLERLGPLKVQVGVGLDPYVEDPMCSRKASKVTIYPIHAMYMYVRVRAQSWYNVPWIVFA